MMYKLSKPIDGVVKTIFFVANDTHISIPCDPANTDYQEFLRWKEEGNTLLPAENE